MPRFRPHTTSLGTVITVGFGIVLLLHGVIAVLNHVGLDRARSDFRRYDDMKRRAAEVVDLDRDLDTLQRHVLMYTQTGHPGQARRVRTVYEGVRARLGEQVAASPYPDDRQDLELIRERLDVYHGLFDEVVIDRERWMHLSDEGLHTLSSEAEALLSTLVEAESGRGDFRAVAGLNLARQRLLLAEAAAVQYLLRPETSLVATTRQYLTLFRQTLEGLRTHAVPGPDTAALDRALAIPERYETVFLEMVQYTRGYLHLTSVVMPGESLELAYLSQTVSERMVKRVRALAAAMSDDAGRFQEISNGVSVLTIVMGVLAAMMIRRRVVPPLVEMTETLGRLARGDLTTKIPALHRKDEVGQMASAAHVFREKAQQTASLLVESRRLHARLRESELRFRSAFDNAPIGLALVAMSGRWLEVNQPLCNIVGYPADELMRTDFQAITHPDDLDADLDLFRRLLAGDVASYTMEKRYLHKDGRTVWVQLDVSVVRDADGKPLYCVSQVQDVTQRRSAAERLNRHNEELRHKNVEMEQFTYAVSHDLKSPLVTCMGLIDCLKEDLAGGDLRQVDEWLERLQRSVTRMEMNINDLLDLSRAGRVRHEPGLIAMDTLVERVVDDLRPRAARIGAEVVIAPGLPRVHGDPLRITEVFENLLANALKYGCDYQHPRVEIGGIRTDDGVRLFVRDNGQGIEARYHEKVFGLFQRLNRQVDGTGVGLALVAKIMEVHGGRAWVESEPGAGATFWLAFPDPPATPLPVTPLPAAA